MRSHSEPILQIVILIAASALLLALFGMLGSVSNDALQSPVWTDMPGASPLVSPAFPDSSLVPGAQSPAFLPTKMPGPLARLFATSFWSSPMPWIAVGIVLFGGLAQALTALFRRFESE